MSYENANEYLNRSRSIQPKIYNEARLSEQPIPNIPDEPEIETDQNDTVDEASQEGPEEVLSITTEQNEIDISSSQG